MERLLGVSVALAFLLIVNLLAGIIASTIWRLIARPAQKLSVRTRAQLILSLRVFPVVAALIFVFAFVVPSFLLHEPDETGEVVTGKLALVALVSMAGVIIAVYQVFRTWYVTRKLVQDWMRNATEVSLEGVDIPVHKIEHSFPVIAVVGIFRPRLFVAEKVFDSLSQHEINASLAHEFGHVAAYDNLKRAVLRVCRDLVIFPIGRGLDRAWNQIAETAADEHAAKTGRSTALDLAAALVKIARIAPVNACPAMPAGAYLLQDDSIDVTSRVRRLVALSSGPIVPEGFRLLGVSTASWLWLVGVLGLLAVPLIDSTVYAITHDGIERLVHTLGFVRTEV